MGLSLTDLSERTGLTRAAIRRPGNGWNLNPTLETLFRSTQALGMGLKFVVDDNPRGARTTKRTPAARPNRKQSRRSSSPGSSSGRFIALPRKRRIARGPGGGLPASPAGPFHFRRVGAVRTLSRGERGEPRLRGRAEGRVRGGPGRGDSPSSAASRHLLPVGEGINRLIAGK